MKYHDLLNYVLPEVPGCPTFTAERAIMETCIDFCLRTDLWKAEPLTINVIPGVTEYDLEAPTGAEVNHVLVMLRQGRKLMKLPFEDVFMKNEQGDPSATSYFAQPDNGYVMIGPKPRDKDVLKVIYSLKPTTKSTSIPDTVGLEWREAIVNGALYRLQMMAGTAWANGGAASTNKTLYDKGVVAALRQSKYGFGGASLTVHVREFV